MEKHERNFFPKTNWNKGKHFFQKIVQHQMSISVSPDVELGMKSVYHDRQGVIDWLITCQKVTMVTHR